MKSFVRLLSAAVSAAPLATVVIATVVTVCLGWFVPQRRQASVVDAFAPDSREFLALEQIAADFGGAANRVEIVLEAADGDLLTAVALRTQFRVEAAIAGSEASRYLDPAAEEPVVGVFTPTLRGLEDLEINPALLDDAAVKQAFRLSLDALGPETVARLSGLFAADGTDLRAPRASAGLVLVELAFPDELEPDDIERIVVELEAAVLPLGTEEVRVQVFARTLLSADEAVQAQIASLMRNAALIILGILFVVMWVGAAGPFTRGMALRRTAADAALAGVATGMSLVWVLGAEAALGPDGLGIVGHSSSITQVVPVLLIGLGVDYAIHLTARYREEIAGGAGVRVASSRAMGAVGVALVLGAATTAVGFLTNVFNPVPTLRDFGILAALGISGAFLLMLTFVPAVRILLDRRAERRGALPVAAMRRRVRGVAGRIAAGLASPAQRFPALVVAAAVATALVGGYALTLLETRFSLVDFVPDGTPALEARATLLERFSGGLGERTSVLLKGPVDEPEAFNAVVAVLASLGRLDDVVDLGDGPLAESPISVVAALAEDDAEFAEFAARRGLRDDLTFASDGDPAAVFRRAAGIDPDAVAAVLEPDGAGGFDAAVVRITTRAGEERAAGLAEALEGRFSGMAEAGVDVTVTSEGIIVDAVKRALSESQTASLAITLAAAMALLVAAFWREVRRPFLGVITILPVALVVLWTYGMMVAAGIPFSPTTAMVAALAIGIGVDYTIHMVRRYLEDRARHSTLGEAVRSTARNTGAALAGSALTTLAGFGILVTSSLGPFRELGAVVVFAIGFSLFAAVVILPAMLVLWDRWHARRRREALAHLEGGGTAVPDEAAR